MAAGVPPRESRRADHAVAGADREQQLGEMGRQAHDAARRLRQHHRITVDVVHTHLGVRSADARAGQQQAPDQAGR
jgi:hypothetical protein